MSTVRTESVVAADAGGGDATALSDATYGNESVRFAYQAGTTAGIALTADFGRYHKKGQPWAATGAGQGWVVNASWRTDDQDGKRQIVCPGGDLGDNETPAAYQAKGCAWATVPVTIDPATGIGTATVPPAFSNTVLQLAAARYQANSNDTAVWFHRPGLYLNVFAEDATYGYYDFGAGQPAGATCQLSNWSFGGSLSDLVDQLQLGWWPGLAPLVNVAAQANIGDPVTVRCTFPVTVAPTPTPPRCTLPYDGGGVIVCTTAKPIYCSTSTPPSPGCVSDCSSCTGGATTTNPPAGSSGMTCQCL